MPGEGLTHEVVYTVSELAGSVRQGIDRLYPGPVALTGELSNVKLSQPSGHYYFTVRDAASSLRGVMFRSAARSLSFQPAEGLKVLLRGRLSYYEARGEVQIVAERMGPAGLGLFFQEFARVREILEKEGLLSPERKRPIPRFPRKVALVTSPTGAAVWDFLRICDQQNRLVPVVILPARVQGAEAAGDLLRALESVRRMPEVDVVVLTRGGGSAEDLSVYNREDLARAILACPVPVVTAIGHEVDVSVADLVADLRVATPTEAAKRVFFDAGSVLDNVRQARRRLTDLLFLRLKEEKERLGGFRRAAGQHSRRLSHLQLALVRGQDRLSHSARERLLSLNSLLRGLSGRLLHPSAQIVRSGGRLSERSGRLVRLLLARLSGARTEILLRRGRIARADLLPLGDLRESLAVSRRALATAMEGRLSRESRRFGRLADALRESDPERPLSRGFFLLSREGDGRLVTSGSPPAVGEILSGRSRDLLLSLRVVDVAGRSPDPSVGLPDHEKTGE